MTKYLFTPIILTAVCLFFSCSKEKEKEQEPIIEPTLPVTSIQVQLDKTKIVADGASSVQLKALSQTQTDITNQCKFYADDQLISGSIYKTTESGVHHIKAKYNSIESSVKDVSAMAFRNETIKKNILLEDYTATWCGYCPRMAYKIEQAINASNQILAIAVHCEDQLAHNDYNKMIAKFPIRGYPSAWINRSTVWDENLSMLSPLLNQTSNVKIGIESGVSGNVATVKALLKFNNALLTDYKLCFYLTEDNLVVPQANFLSDGKGNPIFNFVHNNVLRYSGDDFLGTLIPSSEISLDGTYQKTVTIPLSTWISANCNAVILVVRRDNNQVENVQKVKLGSSISL